MSRVCLRTPENSERWEERQTREELQNKNLKEIYDILQAKYQPFTKRKSVVHKLELKKTEIPKLQLLTSG